MQKPNRIPNNNCYVCGEAIYVKPSVLAKSKSGKAFCGNECYGKFCRKPVECSVCGKEILASKNSKTCSRVCANQQKIGQTYKQIGRSTKDKVRDAKALKKRLIEKVGNKCQRCDYHKIPEVLHAHHIVERSKGGSDELSNLELLCPTCHSEEHFLRKHGSAGHE